MGLFDGNKFNFQSAVDKIQGKIADITQASTEENETIPPATNNVAKAKFCSNCGTKLNEGAKFCHGCGASTINTFNSERKDVSPPPVSQPMSETKTNFTERQQEFVGKILKCPNCGGHLTETTAICPDCGYRITERAAVTSIQAFKEQLMAIENSRKGGLGGVLGVYSPANKSDIQKLSLIRNFPIPNSIDDCLEFMMLAIANIDVSLSKNTFANRINSNGQVETAATIGRTISNAWVSKMEQVYRKAEIVFPNDPAFAGIQKMYFEKMKELKIKQK